MNQLPSENNILDKPLFAWITSGLVLFSLISFSVSTLPELSSDVRGFLRYSEIVIVLIFTAEYITRIVLFEKPLKFIFSFYGLIDLLAILPFYLAFSFDLRSLRVVRLFRLIRILKLARYNGALNRFAKALYLAKEELLIFLFASAIVLYFSAVGIYHFEHAAQPEEFRSIFDCLWWSVATLTTVGYGDVYPITDGGRAFTFGVLLVGLGLVAVPAGIVASALSAVRREQESKR